VPKTKAEKKKASGANLGFEATLWQAADKLRGTMDASEYKHVVLGLLFLKYISDTFDETYKKFSAGQGEYAGANPEDRDEYLALNVFWVPKSARWATLQAAAKQPQIGKLVDDAMDAIEKDNPRLKGVLPKEYAKPSIDKQRLGELIDLLASIGMSDAGPSANVFLDASAASDPDGFAALVWNWGFSLLRFRFETPIRAIWLETGGWSQSTGAWSDDGSISGFVNDSTYLNLGLVFEVPVSTVVVSTQWMQDFHVEFVPAPGVIPFMVFGAAGLPLRRRR
jgi:hypothetical protein